MTDKERRDVKAEAYEEAAFLAEQLGDEYLAACIRGLKDRQQQPLIVVPGVSRRRPDSSDDRSPIA